MCRYIENNTTDYIRAFQYDGDFMYKGEYYCPKWVEDLVKSNKIYYGAANRPPWEAFVHNDNYEVRINVGDYIYQRIGTNDVIDKTYVMTPQEFNQRFTEV